LATRRDLVHTTHVTYSTLLSVSVVKDCSNNDSDFSSGLAVARWSWST